jgi:hypothetical protein
MMGGGGTISRDAAWAEARRLVVQEGATYAAAAEATGLPLRTVQKRAGREGWQGAREVGVSYAATAKALKAALLDRAMRETADGDPNKAAQLIFAWKQAESAFPEHRYSPAQTTPAARLAVASEVLGELVAWLEVHDRVALATVGAVLQPFAAHLEAAWAAREAA